MNLLIKSSSLVTGMTGSTVEVEELVIDGLIMDGIVLCIFVLMGAKVVLGAGVVVGVVVLLASSTVDVDWDNSRMVELWEISIVDELVEFNTVFSASSNI